MSARNVLPFLFGVMNRLVYFIADERGFEIDRASSIMCFNYTIIPDLSKQLPILPHHNLVHLLHGIGTIIIKPRCDDGAESVDKERDFIVAGGVVAFGFETSA
jgi:hypothetical protein